MASEVIQSAEAEDPELQDRLAYRWLMADPRGRRIVRNLMRWTGIEETGPLSGRTAMAVATGRRQVGNILRALLRRADPQGWVAIEEEFTEWQLLQAKLDDERAAARLPEVSP